MTLTEVIQAFPVQQGLAEVLAYLAIATKQGQHKIDPTIRETVDLWDNFSASATAHNGVLAEQAVRQVTLPQIIFQTG